MSQSSVIAGLLCDPVSPKGTQEEEYVRSSSHQTIATPYGEPQGSLGSEKKTQYVPQIAEVHMKGMISVSPDSCIFPYTESTKFLNLGYLVFFNDNLLMFRLPALCCKTSI